MGLGWWGQKDHKFNGSPALHRAGEQPRQNETLTRQDQNVQRSFPESEPLASVCLLSHRRTESKTVNKSIFGEERMGRVLLRSLPNPDFNTKSEFYGHRSLTFK